MIICLKKKILKQHWQWKSRNFQKWLISANDVSRIFVPVYRYGHPNPGTQKRKYTFLYTDTYVLPKAIFLPFQPKSGGSLLIPCSSSDACIMLILARANQLLTENFTKNNNSFFHCEGFFS